MRVVMMGTGSFAVPPFEALLASRHHVVGLVTQPDRAGPRAPDAVGPMKQIALAHGVPVYQPESVNTPEGVATLRAWAPDLLVVADYGQILKADVLETASRGGINVHGSLLPKYRGAAPIAWALYNGDAETGVTIIRMSTKLDGGDMLAKATLPILPDDTTGSLKARLAPLGGPLTLSVIDQIEAGTVHGEKQDPAEVTKAPKLTKEHGLIDWSRPAATVCRQVRAMQPWPTAYTFLHREGQPPVRVLILRATPMGEAAQVTGGTVTTVTKDRLVVAAGEGQVALLQVQPAGKRVLEVPEWLRGARIAVGDRFGLEG